MKKKLKIAIFHCGFIYTGGGERIVIEEILGLRKQGYHVDCFVPNYDPNLSYPDIIKKLKIKTFTPQLPEYFPLRFAIQMVLSCLLAPFLAFRYKKYDIFFGANQPGAYMAWVIAGILKKPYYVYLNQPNRVLYPRDNEDWQNVKDYYFLSVLINRVFKQPIKWLDKMSITKGRRLLINGGFVAKEICKVYNVDGWVDCPGGAHPVKNSLLKNNRVKGEVKINGFIIKKPYILFTSRHEPWKRFDWAIEAFQLVLKKYAAVNFVIPGAETTITPKLKKLAQRLKIDQKVIFTGAITQDSLWQLYRNAYVYIFTSPKEDLGIVVEEAQAAGVPVVAWNAGGPTVTVVNGRTGFLVKPYDQAKMAEKIVYLLQNPRARQKMGKSAWQHIKKNFTWERHIAKLEREFKSIIK